MKFPIKFGTHIPVLMALLPITDGDVLELGTGLYSTPYLHWACSPKRRNLVSYENDGNFYQFSSLFQDEYHKIFLVDDWDKADIERPWDIALIDHGPRERRIVDIARLVNFAKYVVVHDTYWKEASKYHYANVFPLFKYRYDYKQYKPHTTVLSNFIDLKGFSA